MARALPVVLTVVLVASAAVLALNFPHALPTADAQAGMSQNDAGSGGDAGDAPAGAVLIANERRVFTANLTPPGVDSDWYRHELREAFCSVAQASASSAGTLTLTAESDGSPRVSRPVEARRSLELAIASPAGGTPYLGFEPSSLFSATSTGDDTSPDPGRYTFTFRSFNLAELDPEGDGESPEAGSTPATARTAASGCFAGSVASVSDTEDWHALDVSSPRQVTVSFALAAAGDARLELRAPTGEVRATIADGEVATVWADEGRWHLVVLTPPVGTVAVATAVPIASPLPDVDEDSATDYLIGLTDGPGSSNACRPTCLD